MNAIAGFWIGVGIASAGFFLGLGFESAGEAIAKALKCLKKPE